MATKERRYRQGDDEEKSKDYEVQQPRIPLKVRQRQQPTRVGVKKSPAGVNEKINEWEQTDELGPSLKKHYLDVASSDQQQELKNDAEDRGENAAENSERRSPETEVPSHAATRGFRPQCCSTQHRVNCQGEMDGKSEIGGKKRKRLAGKVSTAARTKPDPETDAAHSSESPDSEASQCLQATAPRVWDKRSLEIFEFAKSVDEKFKGNNPGRRKIYDILISNDETTLNRLGRELRFAERALRRSQEVAEITSKHRLYMVEINSRDNSELHPLMAVFQKRAEENDARAVDKILDCESKLGSKKESLSNVKRRLEKLRQMLVEGPVEEPDKGN